MILCCGEERSTRFCPDCGKELGVGGPLAELLAHCRSAETMHRTRARGIRQRIAVGHPDRCDTERNAARAEQIAAKWGAWAKALAGLMAGAMSDRSEQGPVP